MTEPSNRSRFIHRVGIAVVLIGATLAVFGLLLAATQVLLLAFAGILGGILLDAVASVLHRLTRLPRALALPLAILGVLGAVVGFGWLVGPRLWEQFQHLAQELPSAFRDLMQTVTGSKIGQWVDDRLPPVSELLSGSSMMGEVAGIFSTMVGIIGGAIFVVVVSVYFAARPASYIEPAVRLVPPSHRPIAEHLLETVGHSLRSWLVARFVSMVAVGLLTGLGLWLLGIPAAASLGFVAGAFSFIPNLGPVLASLPGILLGLAESPMTAVWAALIYMGAQALEGNFITPYAEQQAVRLPPAFLLTVQLLMGLFTGILGLLVATPLVVVVVLTIRELYVGPMESAQYPSLSRVIPESSAKMDASASKEEPTGTGRGTLPTHA